MNKFLSLLAIVLLLAPSVSNAQFGAAILQGLGRAVTSPSSSSSSPSGDGIGVIDAEELFPEVSRVELKAIQTRKFNKSPKEVFSAIKSLCADKSGLFSGALPVYKGIGKPLGSNKKTNVSNDEEVKYSEYERVGDSPLNCIRKTGLGGGQFRISNSPEERYRFAVLGYELSWNPADAKETIVRMRIRWSRFNMIGGGTSEQTTAATFYQTNFKELADGMFIDAIQLTPAEMQ